MTTLERRLKALETMRQEASRPVLSVLVMDGPNAEREVAAWRAQGYEAVIDSQDPLKEAFLG